METINVELHDGAWAARWSDPDIRILMGTDLIPTPFLVGTPREKVVTRLQALNPGYKVS